MAYTTIQRIPEPRDKRLDDMFIDYSNQCYKEGIRINPNDYLISLRDYFSDYNQVQLIIDPMCGCGESIDAIAKVFPNAKVIGYDISDRAIAVAKERYIQPNLFFGKGDVIKLSQRHYNEADLIFCRNSLHHLQNNSELNIVIDEFYKSLKQRGRLLIYDLDRDCALSVRFQKELIGKRQGPLVNVIYDMLNYGEEKELLDSIFDETFFKKNEPDDIWQILSTFSLIASFTPVEMGFALAEKKFSIKDFRSSSKNGSYFFAAIKDENIKIFVD